MTFNSQSTHSKLLYDRDFYLWIETTAKLLKETRFDEIDINNLIEEIESMGRSEKRELTNRLITLIEHFLKLIYWQSEKDYNARGWSNTIIEQRKQIELLLKDSPSLKNILPDLFLECYQDAKELVLRKSNLPMTLIPSAPPFELEDVLNPDYWAEELI